MVYLLASDTTAERSGERERRTAASLKPNSCVCDLRQPCKEPGIYTACAFKPAV